MNEFADRISGVLFGLAAVDLIGGPLAMALTLAECLADHEAFTVEEVGQRYFEWWRTRGFDSGPTAARVFSRVAAGDTFEAAAQEVHDDNGGLTA
jgi:ADP-ribosylglycohydrolase